MPRIALLVDSCRVSHWTKDLVDWIDEQPDLELCALIVHPAPQTQVGGLKKLMQIAETQGVYTALSRTAFGLLSRAERLVLRAYRRGSYDLSDRPQLVTEPIVSKSGFVYRFSARDIARIRELNPDILVRCGNGILKGDILTVAKHGVLSMHHGDNRVNRGGPAAFWEVLERQPYTGFIVQRLNEELDGGEVLCRGRIMTRPFYTANQVILSDRSYQYLKKSIRDVLAGKERAEPPLIYDRRLYKTPLLHDSVGYLLKTAAFVTGKAARKLGRKEWRWGVAYTLEDWRSAVLWRAKAIPNPPGHFLADPFAVCHQGEHYIFVEDYSYKRGKGIISAYRLGDEPEPLGPVVEEDFHLSFPFVFRFDDELYMIPESSGNRDIRIYRCAEFPKKWELHKIAMKGVLAVDTMIFPKDGKWWMLTTIKPGDLLGNNDAELHVFWTDNPLGSWTPHPLNPVMIDAGRGRNAGLLGEGDNIYRAAQRHAFSRYGAGFSIYRINELTEESYSETLVQDVDPHFLPGIRGTHHIHHDGGLTVFDFVRDERP